MPSNTILVVEDDPLLRELVARALRDEGYTVDVAGNGIEALDAVAAAMPGLILLDLKLPVLDGWGVVRELHSRGVQVPILITSASTAAEVFAEQLGVDGCLGKPFTVGELVRAVAQFRLPCAA